MSLVKKFASVGGATMASRALGFVREAMIGAALGAGPIADAFYAAFRFPNLFRRIFAEGAFNTAFIPLFAKEVEADGRQGARGFAEEVLSFLVMALLVLSAVAMIFMPFLVGTVIAPKFADTPDKFDATVVMTRIMFPYLFAMSLLAMLSGILNSLRKYFLAALAPVFLNALMIVALILANSAGADARSTGLWISWGVVVSGFVQVALVGWGVWREGFALSLKAARLTPRVRRLLVLMGPAVLTGGVVQINLLVGQIIASAQDGAIALLNYADRINQLPLGVIGVAIGVVLLPELSRALKANDDGEAQHLQNRSLEFALGLTLPAAVGLMVFPGPIVALIYQRGAFTPETTQLTAAALAAFASGLPAYVLAKVFQPAYFAREDTRTPLWFSIANVAVNIVFSLALFPLWGHVALAAATSVAAWVNIGLLVGGLWLHGHYRPSPHTVRRVVMIVASSAIMGLALWGMAGFFADWLAAGFWPRLAATIIVIALAAIVYFAAVVLTGGLDRDELMRALRRRRG